MKKIAIDSYYYPSHKSYTVGVIFQKWDDAEPLEIISYWTDDFLDYIPGQFYKRELPGILGVLGEINLGEYDTIILDGYVYLKETENTPTHSGLGEHLWEHVGRDGLSIIGVAKTLYGRCDLITYPVCRGESINPLRISCMGDIGTDPKVAGKIIENMAGDFRIPRLLKILDQKTKEFR